MFLKIILSVVGIASGFVLLIKTKEVIDFTGANNWVEEKFGSGQSYTFMKLLGILVIFGSFLYLVGDLDKIVKAFVSIIFP